MQNIDLFSLNKVKFKQNIDLFSLKKVKFMKYRVFQSKQVQIYEI